MRHEDILSLLDGVLNRLADSDVHALSLEAGDVTLRIERGTPPTVTSQPPASVVHVAPPLALPKTASADPAPESNGAFQVKSPVVGTFYAAPTPEAAPYVMVGSRVSKGDTLCILEAMKMMNEIEADRDGVITRILVKNGELVEFGQPLFELEAAE